MTDAQVLDLSRLEVALGGDPDLMGEILEMYETTARDDLVALGAAVDAGDVEQIMRKAHGLKGSSGNVGADRVMGLAAQVEKVGRAGSVQAARHLYPALVAAFDAAVAASRSWRTA